MEEKKNELEILQSVILQLEKDIQSAKKMIFTLLGKTVENGAEKGNMPPEIKAKTLGPLVAEAGSRVIEGVFDGLHMVGPDGKRYNVAPNYASKSKLVEGDVLKLMIAPDGSFTYKQIGPIERDRLTGVLMREDGKDDYKVLAGGKDYNVLQASVTYFHGEPGDEVVLMVPKGGISDWGAVENIIKAEKQRGAEVFRQMVTPEPLSIPEPETEPAQELLGKDHESNMNAKVSEVTVDSLEDFDKVE